VLTLAILGGAVAGLATYGSGRFQGKKTLPTGLIQETVTRGPLEVVVLERGNLESSANVTVTCKVEGSTTIIKIVEEGTAVKKGDLLFELDSSAFKNDLIQQQIAMETAIAAEKQAVEALAIQRKQNESDIAAAKLKLELAELDLEKYLKGESIQESKTVEGEVALKREELTRAKDKFDFTSRISKKGYATQTELEADRIAVSKATIELRVADEKLRVLQEYSYKRSMTEKEANAKEFVREVERTERKAKAAETQAEADLKARTLTAQLQTEKYKKVQQQIEFCLVHAPQDGLVVYANERSSRGGSNEVLIAEGASVRERQAIINLPDVSKMRVNARIHESKIDMVRERLPANIRVDARPGIVFKGEVDMVSLVPLSGNWPNYNLKEYSTFIAIKDASEAASTLKPGLTAEVEILVDRLADVLQIPLQAVVARGTKNFAFVVKGVDIERREITTGKTNDVSIEIKDGLAEGEAVVLNPRAVLSKELEALEEEIPVETESADGEFGGAKMPPPDAGGGAAKKRADGAGGPGSGSAGPGEGRRGPPDMASMLKRLDKNGDGKIQLDEVDEPMRERMATADLNGDKTIDESELKQMAAKFQGGGRPGGGPGGPGGGGPPRDGGRGPGAAANEAKPQEGAEKPVVAQQPASESTTAKTDVKPADTTDDGSKPAAPAGTAVGGGGGGG
jgi:HlyD family secretion protein